MTAWKLAKIAAPIFLLLIAFWRVYEMGADSVQAKWTASVAQQTTVAAQAQAQRDVETATMRDTFNTLRDTYEATTHAQPPSVADSVVNGLATGALKLRDSAPACPAAPVQLRADATGASRAADAAATQALADRTAASIAALRAGDAADRRETQLDAQITGLQGLLTAERSTQP